MRALWHRVSLAPWFWAALAAALVLGWQSLTVRANYAGNWSGLFRVGAETPLPDPLGLTTFRNAHPNGYDGQYYRLLAYDPLLRRGTAAFLDSPVRRARRILIPWLACALALGQPAAIDPAFILVILASIFCGVFFLARIMALRGMPPALGLLFLAVPATLIAIDTLTVDVSLAALTIVFVWTSVTGRSRAAWLALAASGLVRETGLLLVAACVLSAVLRRHLRQAALWGASAIPALLWFWYVQSSIPRSGHSHALVPRWLLPELQVGVFQRALHPPFYPNLGPAVERIVQALDVLSLLATAALAILALLLIRSLRPDPQRTALALFAAFLFAISNIAFWTTPYGYGRPFAPLFALLLAADVFPSRRAWLLSLPPLALIDLRVAAEMKTQALGVLRWVVSG